MSEINTDYDILFEKLGEWSIKFFVDNGSRTSILQKNTLYTILRDKEQDLYQLSRYGTTCAFCASREGRVYSRSGKDPIFPPLALAFQKIDKNGPDVLWNTYLVTHPNTLHSLTAWSPVGMTDEEVEQIKRFSCLQTNPLSFDPRSQSQKDAYNRKIKGRKKWLRDYRLFESCQRFEIVGFPKTFQTFQKHKLASDQKYLDWMRQYSVFLNSQK